MHPIVLIFVSLTCDVLFHNNPTLCFINMPLYEIKIEKEPNKEHHRA